MIVWLLDLTLGGTVFRFATKAASASDGTYTRVYSAGLQPVTVDIGGDGPSGRSVALTVDAVPQGYDGWLDVPGIRGMLEAGSAVLRRWREGEDLRKARVMARGSLTNPSVSRGAAPLVLSLESPPWADGTRVIRQTHMVTTASYPTPTAKTTTSAEVDPQVYGSYPPVVIGYPGDVRTIGSATGTPTETAVKGPPDQSTLRPFDAAWAELGEGSPGLKVEMNAGVWNWWDRIAIASHPVAASSVIVWDQSDQRWDLMTVSHGLSALGETFAYVDYSDASGMWLRTFETAGHELWIVWTEENGGGLRSDSGGTMEGLGEVLRWMLAKMDSPVSLAAQQGERAVLDSYKLSAYINTDITVWDWVTTEVIGLFPVRWVEDSDGGYLRHWDLTPGVPVVADLHTTRMGLEVVSDLLCDTSDVRNFLTLRYSYGPDGVHKSITFAAEAGPSGSDQRAHPVCTRSEARYGRRAYTWESRIIKDNSTATRTLAALAREHALAPWSLVLSDPESRWLEHLRIGDRIKLTAPDENLTDTGCIVEGLVLEGQETRALLRLIEED